MFRWRSWRRASAWLGLVLAPVAAGASTTGTEPAASADASSAPGATADHRPTPSGPAETLVLAVTVDGRATDEPVMVHRVGAAVSMAAADLRALGIVVGSMKGDVPLGSIRGLGFTVDVARQSLAITTGRPTRVAFGSPAGAPAAQPLTRNGWGIVLNYDVTAYRARATGNAGGSLEGIAYTPDGYAFAGAVAFAGDGRHARVSRTDIGYTVARPDRLLRATIGDFINAASDTSRPIRMTGLKIGTDFSLRPDLVTFPLPGLSGTAAVASSIDLIVNGNRQSSADVGPGRFSVSDVPVQTGVNTVSVAVRDALGRSTVQTVTTYASRDLLRPGLSAFSAELGLVRIGYLTAVDRYRDVVASGSWRRGFSEVLTLEAHVEGMSRNASGSMGGALGLGRFGLATASVGIGRSDPPGGRVGTQIAVGFERLGRPVSVVARYVRSAAGWRDLAARYGSVTLDHSLVLNVGFDLARHGTLGVGLLDLGRGTTAFDWRGGRLAGATRLPASTLVNATYSVRLTHGVGLLANLGFDARRRRSAFASLGAVIVFGPRTSGYVGASRGAGGTIASATINRTPVEQGDWGYRAVATTGIVDRIGAGVQHLGRAGLVEAALEDVGGSVAVQASARGSIGHAMGHSFVAPTLTDSFAMVDASGRHDVAVYRDNRLIGTTDRRGILVVPDLASYETTKFSIDPTALDPSLVVGQTEMLVRPGRRVGVRVPFDVQPDRSVLFTLVDEAGRMLPAGAHGRFDGAYLPVGFDGQAYMMPGDGGIMVVDLPDGRRCTALIPPRRAIAGATTHIICHTNRIALR